jgi:hypothetical protein
MSVNRQHVRLFRSLRESDDDGFMPRAPAERLAQIWEFTRELWLFADHAVLSKGCRETLQ